MEACKNFESAHIPSDAYPNRKAVVQILDDLRVMLFPGYFEPVHNTGKRSKMISVAIKEQISLALGNDDEKADVITEAFLTRLSPIQELLSTDVQAMYDGDPAAASVAEIILCYPGLYALTVHRIAYELFLLSVPLIPRMMSEHAHSETGIDIHPGAKIGRYFCIDHGTGIVIGETTEIGERVKLYQGVTLGALSTKDGQKLKNVKRRPTIRDDVTIYSGASILGGGTVIGEGTVIGGNAFIVDSVPIQAVVKIKKPELKIRTQSQPPEEWFYQI